MDEFQECSVGTEDSMRDREKNGLWGHRLFDRNRTVLGMVCEEIDHGYR